MMADLIDKAELLSLINRRIGEYNKMGESKKVMVYKNLMFDISNIPTVDAVPVRQRRWIPEPDRHYHWHCSECGFVEGARAKINKYCPNCGADMREE